MTTSARKARQLRHPAGTNRPRPATRGRTQRDPVEADRVGDEDEGQGVLVPQRLNIEQPESVESDAAFDELPVPGDGEESIADDPCIGPRRGSNVH